MSQWTGRLSDDSEFSGLLGWLEQWYHVPTLVLAVLFMFWARARTWGLFVRDGEVLFSGNDPWYHFREVVYVTNHWPETIPYDVWTRFPEGTSVSQFGTIYDQAVGTIALIVGLGNPSEATVATVVLFAPAVMGALMVIPTYYLGKRLGGRLSGVIAVLVIALASGEMLRRSLVGFADHHIAEAFTQAMAVVAIVVALQVADREKPVWELVVDRDYAALRRPLGYAALAGVGTAAYIWTWPPGVLLVGILGLYFTVQLSVSYLRGESPEHVAMVGATLFSVTAVLVLIPLDSAGIQTTSFSLLQPGLALAGALWCVFLAWLGRELDDRGVSKFIYPAVAVGLVVLGAVLLRVLSPDTFGFLVNNISRVLVPGSSGQQAGTVGEVQPLAQPLRSFYEWFGLGMVVAGVGVLLAIGHQIISDEPRSELLFVSLWFLVIVLATLTQQRFAYYLTVPIAALIAYVIGLSLRYLQGMTGDGGIQTYQILAVLTAIMLVVVPMITVANVAAQSGANGPGGVIGWDDSLDWMEDETPDVGTFAGADNEMNPWATVGKTDDYQYPAGSYGVMSWWDYGHWITANGMRIPVANPFQQAAVDAAQFLLSDTESESLDVLGNLSDGENADTRYVMVDWKMATANPGWGRLSWGKFFAPSAFLDDANESDYFRAVSPVVRTQQGAGISGRFFTVQKQAFYETMVVRLYRYHGSAASPGNVPGTLLSEGAVPVVMWEQTSLQNGEVRNIPPQGQNASTVRLFRGLRRAKAFVNQTNSGNSTTRAQIGGLGKYPSEPVPALEHYRLVQTSETPASPLYSIQPGLQWFFSPRRQGQYDTGISRQQVQAFADLHDAYTKVFERVPGAEVRGQGPANATITASVTMEMPGANSTFDYRQQAETGPDGEFTMRLPYSSTGYDDYGPENGYSNVSVRATGAYEFTSQSFRITNGSITPVRYNDTAHVTEGQVVGQNDTVTSVNLTLTESSRVNATVVDRGSSGGSGDGSSGSSGSGSLTGPSLPSVEPVGESTRIATTG